ncbi:flagellar biosynthetic protein FliP [Terriglobus roseus DSM 18391]|uniref:Flagellar biosynthetic protein FliP n=1 Tax=Terriglobus roseus (strain DSM 18391 / NRRL B-41598 / KBS 63) TaxID=926566 RepID=U3GK03_TERRK|nr:flagellar type III secretion system pore protein FliP [Terriglobus roseus]AFL88130.1 flagellar biosynthetic protein FliP [Terriglobus roseus DSM 18391]
MRKLFPSSCLLTVIIAVPLCLHAQSAESFWVRPTTAVHTVGLPMSPRPISTRSTHEFEPHRSTTKAIPAANPAKPTQESKAPGPSAANSAVPAGRSIAEALATGNSSPWSVAVGLTLLTLVPAMLLAMTPLVRLLVVFHFLRQALGTQTAPSNQILMALGLMMTWFLMQPVITQVNQVAIAPYRAGTLQGEDALSRGVVPVKTYMLRYARDKDLELFASASQVQRLAKRDDAPMQVVLPAYMLSELKAGFQIGAILFLPFLLVDLVVASVTTSVGMLQMPPTVISTPVKILLFVMVDGWHLLASSLLKSF